MTVGERIINANIPFVNNYHHRTINKLEKMIQSKTMTYINFHFTVVEKNWDQQNKER